MSRTVILMTLAILMAACNTQPLAVDTDAAEDEMSHDGLYPVKNTVVDFAWAKPDIDLTGYDKVLIQTAGIQYRPVKARAGARHSTSSQSQFPLTEKQKARVQKEVSEAFFSEFEKGTGYTVVSEPGPDVLIVRGGLLDVVSYMPPERIGRTDVYLDRIGAATLVLELVDSESDAVLMRVIDRRAAEQRGIAMEANSVTNAVEVRRLARDWARRLRENLDKLSTNLDIGIAE